MDARDRKLTMAASDFLRRPVFLTTQGVAVLQRCRQIAVERNGHWNYGHTGRRLTPAEVTALTELERDFLVERVKYGDETGLQPSEEAFRLLQHLGGIGLVKRQGF